jgi:ribose transport system substrate-binding protein
MAQLGLRRLTPMAVGVAAAAILLAACSSGSSGSSSTASSTSSATTNAGLSTDGLPTLDQMFKGNATAPPTSSPPAAKGKSIWWISCGQQAASCAQYAAAGKAAAQAIGWTFHLADGNLNIANGYATAMRTALAAHPSAIVEDAFSCTTVQPELEQAKQEGVAVLGLETTDCSDAGTGPTLFTVPMIYSTTYPGNKAWWTGWGQWSADFMIADSGGKAKIIASPGQGDPQFSFLSAGFRQELAKCSGCSVVDNVPWTTSDLAPNGPWVTALRNALIKNPDANYVWWPFDTNAVTSGGAKAVLETGSKAKVVSGIGIGPALELISSGQMDAEGVARDSNWESWAAIDELNRYFNHKPSAPEGLGFVSITKSHNMPANPAQGYQTSVQYVALYKKAWGV